MWIDLNQDGIFTDSTELLVDPVSPITTSGWTQNVNIPDSIALGQTRMRVALESIVGVDTLRPNSCGSFLFGEVEDYCISIDDVCPEIQPSLRSVTETSAVVSWPAVEESIVFVYRYRNIEDGDFGEPELTQDTIIEITGLEKCETYVLQTLSVCVQDTSSWLEFIFETECPDAVRDEPQIVHYWHAYPNPFADHLTLEFKPIFSADGVLRLYNLYGVELQNEKFTMQQDAIQRLQMGGLAALPSGVYLLSLEVNQRKQVLKAIKL
jgi:hypothetical protein